MPTTQNELPADLGSGDAYYTLISREGETATYRSTLHAQGAWNVGEQHMAPATGVLVHELQRFQPREGMRLVRISLDILGFIPGGEFTVTTQVTRPGRTIELLEARLEAGGRTSIVATAWRLLTSDTSEVATSEDGAPLPAPEELAAWDMHSMWPGGYIESLTCRYDPESVQGHGRVWFSNPYGMVLGEETTPLVKLLGMVDTANGIARRFDPREWLFPNVDLQIHLYRDPVGEVLGLDTVQNAGPDGVGLTSSVLHDRQGPFGRAEQILTLRRR